MSDFQNNSAFEAETIREKRKMPVKNIIIMAFLVLLQVLLIALACFYEPVPLDVIEHYNITVDPLYDGTLNIQYDIVWKAVSADEPLTWVEIGVPNSSFTIDPASLSENIYTAQRECNEDYSAVKILFKKSYSDGETVHFTFAINQAKMLCQDQNTYLYEFVPGWFNELTVDNYKISWLSDNDILFMSTGAKRIDGYYVWEGTLNRGEYVLLQIRYRNGTFANGAEVSPYVAFNDSGAHDDLDDSGAIVGLVIVFVLCIAVAEIYLVDSFVSYGRGRGFLTGYGHPIHVYGYGNPRYRQEVEKENARKNSGYHGSGRTGGCVCACACACACAGGGRAGCSRKAPSPGEGSEMFKREKHPKKNYN